MNIYDNGINIYVMRTKETATHRIEILHGMKDQSQYTKNFHHRDTKSESLIHENTIYTNMKYNWVGLEDRATLY